MKLMKFAVFMMVILFTMSGCPGGGDQPSPAPVTEVTVKNGSSVLSAASVVQLQVGGETKDLDVLIAPSKAEAVAGFTVQASSDDPDMVTAVYNAITKKVTLTPVSETADNVSITVMAKNNDNGTNWIRTTFRVLVNSSDYIPTPVTGIAITDDGDPVTATTVLSFIAGEPEKQLDVQITPSAAVNITNFSVDVQNSDQTKVTATYNASTKKISVLPLAETADDVTITVRAKNQDNADWVTTTFKVHVEELDGDITPVLGVTVKNGTTTLSASSVITFQIGGLAKVLDVSVSPVESEEVEGFTIEASSGVSTQVTAAYSSGKITLTPVAVTTEDVTITARAKNDDNDDWKTATFKVRVIAVDPNTIFMWSHADNGEPTGMTWNSGSAPANAGKGVLHGFGTVPDVRISITTNGNTNGTTTIRNEIRYDEGILLDAFNGTVLGTGVNILTFGSDVGRVFNGATTGFSTTSDCTEGDFNFYDIPAGKGVKLTMSAEIIKDATWVDPAAGSPKMFRVCINDNSNNGSSPLQNNGSSNRNRLIYFQNPSQAGRLSNSDFGTWDGAEFSTRVFSKDDFTAGQDTLKKAFFGFIFSQSEDLVKNAAIRITGIKIELVPVGSVSIVINPEANFSEFPENIVLTKSGAQKELAISLADYADADWYVDGAKVGSGVSYTLKAADLKTGEHSLSVMVTINGYLYSKSVQFTVTE